MSDQVIMLKNAGAELEVTTQGAYLKAWRLPHPSTGTQTDILYQGSVLKRTGMPILFPYYGKAEGRRQHGFGRDTEWTLEHSADQRVTLSLNSSQIAPEARAEYPYEFAAQMSVELGQDGSFTYSLKVKNLGQKELPLTPGLHPYWALPHADKPRVAVAGLPEFQVAQMDWDHVMLDVAYPYPGQVTVQFPDRQITIEDVTPEQPKTRYFQLWSQTPDQPDFNFVCVEPICGGHFDIDQQPQMVAPGEEWVWQVKFGVKF